MLIKSIENYIVKKRILFTCIGLFSSIVFFLGWMHRGWGFEFDDCGYLYTSRVNSWHDLVQMFVGSDHFSQVWPSNYSMHSQFFFNVYYRPLCRLFFTPQLLVFGADPFGYFIVSIILHGVNALLIFFILYSLTKDYWLATLLSFLFAFHMTIGGWIGWIAAQNYPATMLLILGSVISFFAYLKKKQRAYLLFSWICFLLALFMFEIAIFLPFVFTGFWFIRVFFEECLAINWPSFKKYSMILFFYWIGLAIFFGIRASVYPIRFVGESVDLMGLIVNFLTSRMVFFYADITSFLADFSNVAILGSGCFSLKLLLMLTYCCVLAFLWKTNRYKTVIVFLFLCMIPAMWPAFLKYYRSRYVYFALSFFIIALGILARYSTLYFVKKSTFLRFILGFIFLGIFFVNALHTMALLSIREIESGKTRNAYLTLVGMPEIVNKKLCFFGVPLRFRTCLAQTIWLYGINEGLPIYYDHQTFTHGYTGKENSITIQPIRNGYYCVVNNPQVNWFSGLGDDCSMGKKEILVRHAKNDSVIAMNYFFEQKYLEQDLLFVTWDYENTKFKILRQNPLT